MPTYEYECDACGHAFERFQNMSDKVLRKCPECAKPKLRRLIGSGAGIIFKGSGFYETDYKRKDEQKKSATSGTEKPAATEKSTPTADAKPAKAS